MVVEARLHVDERLVPELAERDRVDVEGGDPWAFVVKSCLISSGPIRTVTPLSGLVARVRTRTSSFSGLTPVTDPFAFVPPPGDGPPAPGALSPFEATRSLSPRFVLGSGGSTPLSWKMPSSPSTSSGRPVTV